jgi:hypothetical protein
MKLSMRPGCRVHGLAMSGSSPAQSPAEAIEAGGGTATLGEMKRSGLRAGEASDESDCPFDKGTLSILPVGRSKPESVRASKGASEG